MATKTEIISDELINDPLTRGYASMVNAEAKRNDGNIEYRTTQQALNMGIV